MSHPELDLVHALADGELQGDEVARLRDHLAACAACRRELDDVIQLEALQKQPVPASLAARVSRPREARRPRWMRPLSYAAAAMAACALLAVAGLRAREAQLEKAARQDAQQQLADERRVRAGLEQDLARLRQPQAGLPVLALRASRGEAGASIALSPSQWFVIEVEREDPPRFDLYRAEVRAADGRVIWRDDALRPASREQIAVAFNALAAGDYRLLLEGLGRAGSERLGEYRFTIRN